MKDKDRIGLDERINIQAGIAKGLTLAQIARIVDKSRSTVYREIVNNATYRDCRHTCSHCWLESCGDRRWLLYKDGSCTCFEPRDCEKWNTFPYCCNGCSDNFRCADRKRYYDCADADMLSTKKRHEPRVCKRLTDDDVAMIGKVVSEGVLLGQSLHHIYETDPQIKYICSERTVRRYLYAGYFAVKAHQLPRYVRYQHKYGIAARKKPVNVERMLGRTYSDYLKWVDAHPGASIWQYDSVEGKKTDKKAILTITFPEFRFQFGILISKGDSASVKRKLADLRKRLGDGYAMTFQCNLSDNGSEFSSFHEIEDWGVAVFFTKPYRSTDKASCERNHEFVRYVLPKGASLDFLTQAKVDLMFSHINSYVRESNKNRTPYDLMVEKFGEGFMEAAGIRRIPAKEVCLKPSLLK